jgi:hypothetical protein
MHLSFANRPGFERCDQEWYRERRPGSRLGGNQETSTHSALLISDNPCVSMEQFGIGLDIFLDLRWFEQAYAFSHFKIKSDEQPKCSLSGFVGRASRSGPRRHHAFNDGGAR